MNKVLNRQSSEKVIVKVNTSDSPHFCLILLQMSYQQFIDNLSIPVVSRHALDHALTLPVPEGLFLEFGVYTGSSINKIATAKPTKHVFGFDSFEGLPEKWDRSDMNFDQGHFSLRGGLPSVLPNVTLIKGWFNETLPNFVRQQHGKRIAFLHIDCDLYSSTKDVLNSLQHMFQDKMIIVFDELINYPGYEKHELLAFFEFLQANKTWSVEWIGGLEPMRKVAPRDTGAASQSVACRLHRSSWL
jgi:hypothetical protein